MLGTHDANEGVDGRRLFVRVPGPLAAEPRRDVAVVDVDPSAPALPYSDDAVGAIWAPEVLQRISDRATFFNECHRVLAHSGLLFTETPSTDGRGAFQDPSHVSHWNGTAQRRAAPLLTSRPKLAWD